MVWHRIRKLLWLSPLVLMGMWEWFYNPLPSDEAMIEHFYEHQAEFEELLRRYRTYEKNEPCKVRPCTWDSVAETQALKEKVGVFSIGFNVGRLWLPDPYMPDAAKRGREFVLSNRYPYDGDRLFHRYAAATFRRTDETPNGEMTLRYGRITKTYMHVPEVPRVENGNFWWPPAFDRQLSSRVFESLNAYPPNWRRAECVYRRFEPQWFIRMCRLAIG